MDLYLNVTELPSKFLPYPKDCKVEYTPFGFGKVHDFNQMTLSEEETIAFIMDNVRTSFDKNDLAYFDMLYLALLMKMSTFESPKYTLSYTCGNNECLERGNLIFTLGDIEFEDLDSTIKSFPIIFEAEETKFSFSPMTVGKYLYCLKNKLVDDTGKYFYAASFSDKTVEEGFEIINNARGLLASFLAVLDKLMYFGLKLKKETCKKCARVNYIELENIWGYLRPFYGDSNIINDRIHFSV